MKKINLTIALLLALVVVVPTNAIAATSLNTTFQSNRGTGPDNFIYNVDMQSDGKVLIVGRITSYNGIPTGELARINTDGSLDTTFNNNLIAGSGGGASGLGGAGYTYFADVQTDGKILVVGNFTTYGSTPVYRIARFNSDGTPDSTFMTNVGTGANNYAFQVQQLQSGKILVDGAFSTFNGTTVSGVVLLNSDGTTDTSFTTNLGTGFVGGTDRNFAETADGKIIIMGDFTSLNGTTVGGIVRLNADGTIDNTFNQGAGFAGGYPYGATAQSNGKLLVVSSATTYDGATISNLVRLNSDGTLDTDFVTNVGSTNNVYKTAVQADGKILVSGAFNTFNGLSVNKIIRLNSDGTTDTSFVTDIGTGFSDGLSKEVGGMVVDSSGNIALGSRTGSFNGVSNTHYLIKLLTDIVIPDTTAPTITNISSSVGSTSSTITWFTNEMADTKMEYGIDTSYGTQSTLDWSLAPSHSVVLTGLSPNTTYHYRVISKDLANNTTTSSDQTFTTSSTGSAPSQITDAVATAGDTTASVAFTAPSDGGSAITSYTVTSSPGNLTSTGSASPITITGLTNGTPYTFTVTATNAIGTSTPSPASNSVTPTAPDTTTPTITNISSDKTNGSYTVGEVIDIDVTFSEVVSSTGNVTITLETGSVDRTCTFTVTSGTTGTCNYTVQSGDISSDLTVSSVSGTIADAASNAMANFTPTTNLADNKAIVIDAVVPTNQDTVFTASTTKQWGTSVTVVSAAESGGAIWFAPSGTTVFSAGSTMTTAGGTATALFTPATEGSYRLFVIDAVGNISAQSIAVLTVDNTSPTITNISSDKTNGSYTVGEVIDIDVTFSEVVSSTGNVTVTLETGSADRTCTFTVTSSTTGTCNYTVQAGDTTSDLTVSSISGTIADAASNVLINFTPTTNLAANKAIVIDTTPTSAPSSFTATVGSPTSTIDLAWTNPLDSDFASVSIRRSTLSYPTTITEGVSVVADITGTTRADIGLTDGLYYYSIFAKDSTGNISASANVVGIVDTTPPVISAGAPSGTLWSGTTSSNLYLTTSETATCKYSTSASTAYSSMTPFSSTTDTAHSTIVSNLTDGTSYTYYTKCQDTLGNTNTADYTISFSIASASSGGGGGYAGGSTITVTQNPGTTVTVVPTPEAPEDDEDDTENEEPTEDSNTDEDNTPYTPNTTVSSVTSAQFTYLSEDPNILVRLQSLYGADVVTEETYKNQCETNAGKPYYRLCELGGVSATFNLFKDSVVCEGFITPQTSEDAYRFEDVAPRKEVVGIAVKMKKIEGKNVSLVTPDSYQNIYTDIGLSGEAAWIQPVAETALRYGITSSARTTFEPDRNVTRAEAYAMVMSSVCMLPETNTTTDTGTTNTDTPKTWQERLFDRASTDGLTSKTWDTFESERPILRQELFLLASKVSDWAERTGGCDPKPEFCFEGGE